jgi:hypothetical protein
MVDPRELTADVHFEPDFDPDSLQWNEQLGFLQISESVLAARSLRLAGFGAPISRDGGFDTAKLVHPLVDFAELPEEACTIDAQGKGVGPRMYNTPQAAHGLANLPEVFGAYVFEVDRGDLLDKRATEGGRLTRIARHASRMIRSVGNVEGVVAGVHRQYGEAGAVLFTQPPRADLRQRTERHAENPADVPAEFIIVRSAAITLRRIGTAERLDNRL